MKLTIGMIVKNEEKWLEKCLTAIKPILDNVDCELIITDTGSTDRTVEIARKFTDKVLHFDWIGDFSAARNTALDVSKGEWFMFLDADEIFKSCDGIIDFFNSGEYKKYNSATYIIRNYSMDGGYSDQFARRLTKRLTGTRFTGAIHEFLNTHDEPLKNIGDIADHYGYRFADESERWKKFDRNIAILEKKFAVEKYTNPMIYSQMYDTLLLGEKKEEAHKYLQMGIDFCKKTDHPLLVLLYCKTARSNLYNNKNTETIVVCNDYFSMNTKVRPNRLSTDIEMLAIQSTAQYRLKKYGDMVGTLETFFRDFDDVKSGKLNTVDRMSCPVQLASDENYITYVGQFLECCIRTGQYEKAAKYMSELPIGKYSDDRDTLNGVIALELMLLNHVGIGYLEKFAGQLDEYGKQELLKGAQAKYTARSDSDKVKLTIGMIVKNEEKWLEKCLTAIKPILDNVDSELIITDTGSTDKTVEIAKRFTDKVLHFEWCNDFAAARNTALDIAQGEWFMFIDADEIFRSCDQIIRFFNSGDHINFNAATYIIRNYTDANEYGDMLAQRLVKLHPETRFVGIIHEYLNTFNGAVMQLNDICDHYGYDNTNKELAKSKFKRNYELLLKKYETDETAKPMVFSQLYDALASVSRRDEALGYLDEGIKWCSENNNVLLIMMFCMKAKELLFLKRNDEVIELCDDYFRISTKIRPDRLSSDIEILAIKATALYRTNRSKEGIETLELFFRDFDDVKNGKLNTADRLSVVLSIATDRNYTALVSQMLTFCLDEGSYDTALHYMTTLPIYKYSENQSAIDELVKLELELVQKTGFNNLGALMSQLDEYGKKNLLINAAYLMCRSDSMTENAAILKECAGGNEMICALAEMVIDCEKYRSSGDLRKCFEMMKDVVTKYPVIGKLTEQYRDELAAEHKTPAVSEIDRLAAMVKSNIRTLIAKGDMEQAEKLFKEYAGLNPNDPEIPKLMNEIE